MRDLKSPKKNSNKGNRLIREKKPRDWRKTFHRLLRVTVVGGSTVLVVCGMMLTARLLLDSDFFRVDSVEVVNNSRIDSGTIIALSDIETGTSMFSLDLPLIGGRIEENPWIDTARVERIFPRKLVIEVREREPRAIVNLGYLYYVDGDGEVFKLLDTDDSLDFPVITGIGRKEMLSDGDQVRERLLGCMDLLLELEGRRHFNLEDISELHSDPRRGLTLFTYRGGIPVFMGKGDFGSKLARLEKVYKEIEPSLLALKYIDLNVADRVIVKVNTLDGTGRG
ncbi:MAG: FtsQ-type POTRA domain-containing protein [Desulfuromonadales bacterium]